MQAAKGDKTKIQVPLQDGTTKTVELEIPAGAPRHQQPQHVASHRGSESSAGG